MAKMLRGLLPEQAQDQFFLEINDAYCRAPMSLKGVPIDDIPLQRFACKFPTPDYLPGQTCPEGCSCYYTPETQTTNVVCSQQVNNNSGFFNMHFKNNFFSAHSP